MEERNTPVCSRGFLTAIKKIPHKNIHKVTAYANDVCDGKKPDLQGKRKKSPYLKVKIKIKINGKTDGNKKETVRPLYPTLSQLQKKIKGTPAIVANYIIGIIDNDGDLHLSRPQKN